MILLHTSMQGSLQMVSRITTRRSLHSRSISISAVKSSDAYLSIININSGPKQNKEEALRVVRLAKPKFPNNPDLPKVEIGLLIDLKRIDEAKSGLESAIKKEPNNKILHFYLGYANASLNLVPEAKKNYEEALRIDPQYFEAQLYLSKLVYADAASIKKEMSNLGISAEDKKKRFELDKQLVEKLKMALPYWEKVRSSTQAIRKCWILFIRSILTWTCRIKSSA